MATPQPVTTQVVELAEELSDGLRAHFAADGEICTEEQQLLDLHALLAVKALKADHGRRRAIADLNGAGEAWQARQTRELSGLEANVVAQLLAHLPNTKTAVAAHDGGSQLG